MTYLVLQHCLMRLPCVNKEVKTSCVIFWYFVLNVIDFEHKGQMSIVTNLKFHFIILHFLFLRIFRFCSTICPYCTIQTFCSTMSIRNLFSLSIRPSKIPVSAARVSEMPGWKHYLPGFLHGPDLHCSEAAWKCTGVSNHP